MSYEFKRGATSVILRIKILDSSATTGDGLTGLDNTSTGLIISTIADNEATATAYTVAGSNVETISTLGTYAAPSSGKCRFKEVDSTNHPGLYEIQIADARYAVSSSKRLTVSIHGATDAAETDLDVRLMDFDPYDSVRAGLTAIPNATPASNGGLATVDANNAVKVQSGTGANQINLSSGNLAGSVGSLGTQAKADVNAEVVDVMAVDTHAEPSGPPAATCSYKDMWNWSKMLFRNKRTQTNTTEVVFADDEATTVASSTKADDGTTFTRGEYA